MSAYLLLIFFSHHELALFTVLQNFCSRKKKWGSNEKFYWHWWQEETRKFDLKQNNFIDWKSLKAINYSEIEFYMKAFNEAWSKRRTKNDYRIDEMKISFYERLHLLRMSQRRRHSDWTKKKTINIKFITQSISTVNSTKISCFDVVFLEISVWIFHFSQHLLRELLMCLGIEWMCHRVSSLNQAKPRFGNMR